MSQEESSTRMNATGFMTQINQQNDESIVREVGPRLVQDILRLLKTAQLFAEDHDHVMDIARELVIFLNDTMEEREEKRFALQLTDANVFINGQLIKFDETAFDRSVVFRAMFLTFSVNQVAFARGVAAPELGELLRALKRVRNDANATLETFNQPHITLQSISHRELETIAGDDVRREVIELYAGLVIKCSQYFHQLRHSPKASARYIKRMLQKCTDYFVEYRHVFIGLIHLKIIRGQEFIHAVNTALYSMFIAQELGLDRYEIVRIGMTAITQNIDSILQESQKGEEVIELGDRSHFKTNMTSVTTLSQMGATDVLSALRLVTTYERGFPYNKPLPSDWYSEELRPHLLSRIVEIAKHYDLLMQGFDGKDPMSADIALQSLSEQMGRHYDPRLAKLFINLIGIFPVGELVLLSTGEQALVVQSPSIDEEQQNQGVAHRPVVKLLDGSERLINLCLPEHNGLRIVQILDADEVEERPGAFFFF